MSPGSRESFVNVGRRIYRRLPPAAQRLARYGRRERRGPAPQPRTKPPKLSVIMPVYNVQLYLDEAIRSVVDQDFRNLELILVDDGSTDRSGQMCDEWAERDHRIRVIHKQNNGLGAARNTGIAAARGANICFIDSDDYVLPGAYSAMMKAKQRSGADLVTGNVERQQGMRFFQAWNQSQTHLYDQHGVTLDTVPFLIYDTVAWNKIFGTEFFRTNVGGFPENKLYEDMYPIFVALAAAKSIEILSRSVYIWRRRDEGDSITQRIWDDRNLPDRLEMLHKILNEIRDRGMSDELAEAMSFKILDGDLWIYLDRSAGVDEIVLERLRTAVDELWTPASDEVKRRVPAQRCVQYWLIEQGRPKEIPAFREWFHEHRSDPPRRVQDGHLLLDVTACPVQLDGIPDAALDMYSELSGRAVITSARWTGAGATMHIEGYAYIRFVSTGAQQISLIATHEQSGDTLQIPVRRVDSPAASREASDTSVPHLHDGFAVDIDWSEVVSTHRAGGDSGWYLSARVCDGDFERTIELTSLWRSGGLTVAGSRRVDEHHVVVPQTERGRPYGVSIQRRAYFAETFTASGSDVRLTLEPGAHPACVMLQRGKRRLEAARDADGSYRWAVPPAAGPDRESWKVVVDDDDPVSGPLTTGLARVPNSFGLEATFNLSGRAVVEANPPTAAVDDVTIGPGGTVSITGYTLGLTSLEVGVGPESGEPRSWHSVALIDGRFATTLNLHVVDHRGTTRPLPSGRYEIHGRVGPGRPASILMTNDTAGPLPVRRVVGDLKVNLTRRQRGRIGIEVSAPVPDIEWSRYSQQREQRRWTEAVDRELEDAVFFFSDMGSTAADSCLALHRELRRRGSELTLYWGVNDLSVAVPEGGVPVLKGSTRYVEALNSSRFIVNTVGSITGLAKHRRQRYLQTWHGTPYKLVGASQARRAVDANGRLARLEAEAAMWDSFVSPNPYLSAMVEPEFLFHGPVLETGYPRNDVLARATDDQQREYRKQLGIDPAARVLLYAPTFREQQRQGWKATLFEGLDLGRLLTRLGPEWTVILRGHSFNARADHSDRSAERLVDATRHPDINELYIASDVLLTDYSSAMFDYAVTGRPILLFTPDLEQYVASRGVYFDLAEVAPSPLFTAVDPLADALLDLDAFAASSAERYAAFRNRFAPWDDGHAAERVVDAFFLD